MLGSWFMLIEFDLQLQQHYFHFIPFSYRKFWIKTIYHISRWLQEKLNTSFHILCSQNECMRYSGIIPVSQTRAIGFMIQNVLEFTIYFSITVSNNMTCLKDSLRFPAIALCVVSFLCPKFWIFKKLTFPAVFCFCYLMKSQTFLRP